MAKIDIITMRAAFATQALSTMGIDPEWDRLLSDFLRAKALYHADNDWGALHQAYEAYYLEEIRMKHAAGEEWRTHSKTRARADKAHDVLTAAEERSTNEFTEPMWQAARELAKYPAPTLAAALFKSDLIYAEEIWNDSDMDADCMQIVTDDMARLVMKEAA